MYEMMIAECIYDTRIAATANGCLTRMIEGLGMNGPV
jgi:hypothetical protein